MVNKESDESDFRVECVSIPVGQKNLLVFSSPDGQDIAPEFLNTLQEELGRWMADENPIFILAIDGGHTVKLEKVEPIMEVK